MAKSYISMGFKDWLKETFNPNVVGLDKKERIEKSTKPKDEMRSIFSYWWVYIPIVAYFLFLLIRAFNSNLGPQELGEVLFNRILLPILGIAVFITAYLKGRGYLKSRNA